MLRIENVCKTYDNGVQALKNVSLEISTGLFGLLGPNGAGKSTLMRTIATLQDFDSGSLFLGDLDVRTHPQRVRRTLGYLPQDFGVYPKISAETLLDHFATLKGIVHPKERKAAVSALLQTTNLYEVRKRKLGTFSGGMRRRFGIAQALLGDPALLIVDEPTAGLDPEERRRFLNLLSEVGEHTVVILSTHIVEDVRELCGRIGILCGGELRLRGEPLPLIAELQGKVWSRPIERSERDAYQESMDVISTRMLAGQTFVHVFATDCPGAGFEPVETDLEDVYLAVVHGHYPKH